MRSITLISPQLYALLDMTSQDAAGGAERQFYLLGRALADAGWRVVFVTAYNGVWQKNKDHIKWAEHCAVDFSYLGGKKIFFLKTLIGLWKICSRVRTDYFMIKMPTHLLFFISLFTKMLKKRSIFWGQMDYDACPEKRTHSRTIANIFTDLGIRMANVVIAQNMQQKEGFKEAYGIDTTIINSIAEDLSDTANIHIEPFKKDIDVLWVGNASLHKRYELVYSIARQLPEYRFVVIMNNSCNERFNKAAREASVHNNIDFEGQKDPYSTEGYYKRAKITLNTSCHEGFPNTFLQTWQNGGAVVSLTVNPSRVLDKGDLGVLVSNSKEIHNDEHIDNAVSVINDLLQNEEKLRAISECAPRYVREHHAASRIVNEFIATLDKK